MKYSKIKKIMSQMVSLAVISTAVLSSTAFFVLAQTKQELVTQVNGLIARADALLVQAGAASAAQGGGFFSSPWVWIPLLLIGVYVIWMLAQHARYRYFHGIDTQAVDERIKRLLEIARDKLGSIRQQLPNRVLSPAEELVWHDTVETVIRRWEGTTGAMRWPIRDRMVRRIIHNGFRRTDARGLLIFVPEIQDIPPAGATPANPARTRLLEDIATCLTAILVAQQLLRDEIGRYFYPRIVRVNALERRLQRSISSPVIHADHNVTFNYDTRLSAPGITTASICFPEKDSKPFPMTQSSNPQLFTFTSTEPFTRGPHAYYYRVTRGAAPPVNEFDPLNMQRSGDGKAGRAPPDGGTNQFTIP